MKNGRHIAEFYGVGVMLAIVGGYLDAYTYISRDHVFANAQTGNMVLLAINIKEGSWLKVFLYLMPILSFMLGVLIVEAVKLKFNEHPRIHWHRIIIGVELVVLTIVGLSLPVRLTHWRISWFLLPVQCRWRVLGKWTESLSLPRCVLAILEAVRIICFSI